MFLKCKKNISANAIIIKRSAIMCFCSVIRAHGGCLDTVRRWRTLQSAISSGEVSSNLWSEDFRMGEPNCHWQLLHTEYIGVWRRPGEVKHLSNQRKRKRNVPLIFIHGLDWFVSLICELKICGLDSLSSGERKGSSLNLYCVVKLMNWPSGFFWSST